MSFVDGEPLEEEKLAAETTAQLEVCGRKGRNGEFMGFHWDFIGILLGFYLVFYLYFMSVLLGFHEISLVSFWRIYGVLLGFHSGFH
jgi:hypothetical protein